MVLVALLEGKQMNKRDYNSQMGNKISSIDKRIEQYCPKHPFISWLIIFIGIPIAILIAVAICTYIVAFPFILMG